MIDTSQHSLTTFLKTEKSGKCEKKEMPTLSNNTNITIFGDLCKLKEEIKNEMFNVLSYKNEEEIDEILKF